MGLIVGVFKSVFQLIFLCTNVAAFCLYGYDKLKASFHGWRVPEVVLLLFSLAGGGLGGFAAMFLFRHKIRKSYFYLANFIGLAILGRVL
ncbi:DUF1294 domain-containing protein [Ezakiella peruensis]|uniref:DUF1294 domain-containing protein n=1 Tax=Ezakiella peruensis TaxID=1464038 RepID=UPI000C1B078C|nr:DUF1294 domain-containing protein [Ezakiella peruensis]